MYATDDQTLLAHRGSYKTTDLSLFLALHSVIRPNENVMFFRKTDDDVTEVVTQARKILKSGAMGQIVFNLYETDLKLLKENNSEIHTNLCTSTKGVSQVVGLGKMCIRDSIWSGLCCSGLQYKEAHRVCTETEGHHSFR